MGESAEGPQLQHTPKRTQWHWCGGTSAVQVSGCPRGGELGRSLRLVPFLRGLQGGDGPSHTHCEAGSLSSLLKGALILGDTVPGSAVANCGVPS